MTDLNIEFSRIYLRLVTQDLKRAFPDIKSRKDAYVIKSTGDLWEFHGPDEFYWYGRADNAYDARAKGWESYMSSKGVER